MEAQGHNFVAGRFAETYPGLIRRRRGHELGRYGWEHGGLEQDEDFRSASYDRQREWIRLATEAVERASGVRPKVFRAPSLWISETILHTARSSRWLGVPGSHQYGHPPCIRLVDYEVDDPTGFPAVLAVGVLLPSYEFVHAHRQSFPRNRSTWNREAMRPENFSLLDAFVEHMLLRGHSSTLLASSFRRRLIHGVARPRVDMRLGVPEPTSVCAGKGPMGLTKAG